jgi:hypothetical protein
VQLRPQAAVPDVASQQFEPPYEVRSCRTNSIRRSPLTTRRKLATLKRIRGASCVWGVTLARSSFRSHRRPVCFR